MSSDPLDLTTVHSTSGDSTGAGEDVARVPALTIVWHPDLRRVGECALIPTHRAEISRLEPIFRPRDALEGEGGAPLSDPHVSKTPPAFTFRLAGEHYELAPGGTTKMRVKVDGARLVAPLRLTNGDLARGVIITVARRIVLCLHRARLVRTPVKSDHSMVGSSDAIHDLRRQIDRVANLDVTVLLRGETGTGKELTAKAIIAAGRRATRPVVTLNMGATVPSTAGSELFGHERGAFTGADSAAPGLFGAADGGSFFLDEVGLMPQDVQKMVLRTLETGEIRPLGSTRTRKVDVRFIAATDTHLERAMAAGSFSPALFQRLARYQIVLPALRERREDFGVLLLHFLRLASAKHGQPDRLGGRPADAPPWLAASTVAALAAHHWDANIRELENCAGEIVIANADQDTATLPDTVRARLSAAPPEPPAAVTPAGRGRHDLPSPAEVAAALAKSNGNATRAAAALRVSRTTFFELRKRHPSMRSIGAMTDDELLVCRDACGGDAAQMAAKLGVPVKALKDRLARLPASPRRPS